MNRREWCQATALAILAAAGIRLPRHDWTVSTMLRTGQAHAPLEVGQWYHVVVGREGDDMTIRIWDESNLIVMDERASVDSAEHRDWLVSVEDATADLRDLRVTVAGHALQGWPFYAC